MSLDDWRDQTQIILGADTDRLLNLLHWLHYAQCSSLNSIDSDIKSVPAYIRARLHERPQLSGNDMVELKRKISEQSTQYEFAY